MFKRSLLLVFILSNICVSAADYKGKSAEEIAKELANPNTPLTSLRFRIQHTQYEGNLPHADSQDSTSITLQPTLPFPLANGNKLWVRPSIPIVIDQPVYQTNEQDFDETFGLKDIVFDVQYGAPTSSGFLYSYGGSITMPTATDDDLGTDKWSAGPGFQVGHIGKQSVVGTFINHQWSFAGSGEDDVSTTTGQVFLVYLPGGGWNVGSIPLITHDHQNDVTTLPLNFTVGRTVKLGERPWKFSVELNYYVDQADEFGPQWMIGLNIAPVMRNELANWFK